jgi:iron complex transport system substrate-binding protein
VTIFSSNTELVAALGLTERIVGIDAFTRYPPEAASKPVVGGRLGFSVEAIAAQAPDLVVLTPARQAVHQILDAMERIGVPALVLMSRTVTEVMENLRLLGRATGLPERGDAVAAGFEARLEAVRARIADRPCRRVVMVTGRLGNGLLLAARLTGRAGYSGMRAVVTGQAYAVPRAEFLIPGPRTVAGIERLAGLLHPAVAP